MPYAYVISKNSEVLKVAPSVKKAVAAAFDWIEEQGFVADHNQGDAADYLRQNWGVEIAYNKLVMHETLDVGPPLEIRTYRLS